MGSLIHLVIMILRVYKVTVPKELHTEFEAEFKAVATMLLTEYTDILGIEIARPSEWKPLEFIMISKWDTVEHIKKMAGENWNEAHIPDHMRKYMIAHSLDHYYLIE